MRGDTVELRPAYSNHTRVARLFEIIGELACEVSFGFGEGARAATPTEIARRGAVFIAVGVVIVACLARRPLVLQVKVCRSIA
jgi:hypothetical protein